MLERLDTSKSPSESLSGKSELQFIDGLSSVESWTTVVERLWREGRRHIGLRPIDAAAVDIVSAIVRNHGEMLSVLPAQAKADAAVTASHGLDAVVLIGADAEHISEALLDYVDVPGLSIVAPVTARYYKNLPLYLISIPKAGTHLLFQLAEALGYAAGGPSPRAPMGGHWYYLLNSNAHTSTAEFFRDALNKAPFGNRAHPFMRSPALFNYRHPLDILMSEANYLHVDGNSPLAVLLSPLSFTERVERLLDDRWLLGTIRDRVGAFAAWLDCANVIPVSFEEMVGDPGGGSEAVLEALIWSLQLKLHVPGRPDLIRAAMSDRASPTFREGKINGWRKDLPAAALTRFKALPQDFMEAFGYSAGHSADGSGLPKHAPAYRRRPLRLMTVTHSDVPYLVQSDYLGHNIVVYQDRYYAIDMAVGALDLGQVSSEQFAQWPNAQNLPSITALIVAKRMESQIAQRLSDIKPLVCKIVDEKLAEHETVRLATLTGSVRPAGNFLRYKLFQRRDAIVAVPMRYGAVDPSDYDLRFKLGIIATTNSFAARLRILWAWVRWAYWDGAKI